MVGGVGKFSTTKSLFGLAEEAQCKSMSYLEAESLSFDFSYLTILGLPDLFCTVPYWRLSELK